MANMKYAKYIISEPSFEEIAHHNYDPADTSGFTYPAPLFLSSKILPGAEASVNGPGWIWEVPKPSVLVGSHTHKFDEMILLIGTTNPHDLSEFNAEVDVTIGAGEDAEMYTVTKTSLIYIPKGIPHGPFDFKRVDKPIIQVTMGLGDPDYS
jgi:hypothetical protein